MLGGGAHRFRDAIASTLDWWAGAGLDAAISEAPVDWLAPPTPPPAAAPPAAAPAPPADLDALVALVAHGDYVARPPPASRRIAPAGDARARLMIVTDCPDAADLKAGRLLAGEAALFDAMLAAMGQTRETVWLCALAPGGRIGGDGAALAALVFAQLALVRPAALLVFGDETARALLGVERHEAQGGLRVVNHDGGTAAAIAAVHPRTLRKTPACKADAWAAMRRINGVLAG